MQTANVGQPMSRERTRTGGLSVGAIARAADAVGWVLAIVLSALFRFQVLENRTVRTSGLLVVVVVAVVLHLVIGQVVLYRNRWQVGSFEEVVALAVTVGTTGAVLLIVVMLSFRARVSAGAVLLAIPLCLVLCVGGRVLYRLGRERQQLRSVGQPRERVLIVGAGRAGIMLVEANRASETARYEIVGFVDDDPAKGSIRVRNVKVLGDRSDLERLVREFAVDVVVIAAGAIDRPSLRAITESATSAGAEVRTVPPIDVLLNGSEAIEDLPPLRFEDLLGRGQVSIDVTAVGALLRGKRVLVTGAGGSIGSELCRQIARFDPSALIMLDRDESALHQVQLSIEGRAMLDSRNLVVCDIRDEVALDRAFAELQPEVLFHAAALKHLPLLEMWPGEAIKSNVVGTANVLRCASRHHVEVVVNISTDKAANPISVLGYSKRIAERLTSSIAERADGRYLSVRFGNVLGSRGSVLTAFQAQIAEGGPVTVTHPEVTRYFMTIAEAVQLTLQATVVGSGGSVLVLEMGEPVSIREVAEQMIEQAGGEIAIVFTGLRFGEKLHEELFSDQEVDRNPVHPLIMSTAVPAIDETAALGLLADGPVGDVVAGLRALALDEER